MSSGLRLLLALAVTGLVGCGGSGGGTTLSALNVQPNVRIDWPAIPRTVSAPEYAQSATIVFPSGAPDGTDAAFTVDRGSTSSATSQTYASPVPVKSGLEALHVVFHGAGGGMGAVVATADANVYVRPSGDLVQPNGSPLGAISFQSRIARVAILSGQILPLGQPVFLAVSAQSTEGSVIAIPVGLATFSVQATGVQPSGSATANPDGSIVGTALGDVVVKATLNGVSGTAYIPVQYPAIPSPIKSLAIANNAIVQNPATGTIWASIPSTATRYGNQVIEIDPNTEAVLGGVFVGSEPGPLAISDDGTTLYVGLLGASQVCRVDTASRTVNLQFSLTGSQTMPSPVAWDMKVQPGNPHVLVLSEADKGTSATSGAAVFVDGVELPNTIGAFGGLSFAFATPSLVWTRAVDTSVQAIQIDGSGATLVGTGMGPTDYTSSLAVFGNLIYSADGYVWNATSGTAQGSFAHGGGTFTVDVAAKRAFFAVTALGASTTLYVYDTTTSSSVAAVTLPAVDAIPAYPTDRSCIVRYGPKGIAFRTASRIAFIDSAPGL